MVSKKILIVDDDKEFLEELHDMLDSSGYDTVAVNDSSAASEVACLQKPDVILLDLKMGGMDGFQVTDKLKQSPETENIPIIAMTGYLTKGQHFSLAAMSGMEYCLIKPFNPLDVICRIEEALSKARK